MHCLFLLTKLIFHVFELLFQYVLSILYVIAKYFSLRATTLQSFTINHNNNNNNLYVLFVKISYQARVYLQISYPAILFTMLMGCLNHGVLLFTSFCREQAKHSHCQFSCSALAFMSSCRAHAV